jgi:hypothetical protein
VVFICPMPQHWAATHQLLLLACDELEIIDRPPVPLILNGWVFSSDRQKHERWQETVEWARDHGLEHLTPPLDNANGHKG